MGNDWKKRKEMRLVLTCLAVIASSALQTFTLQAFLQSGGLLSGGFTGLAILIDRVAALYGRSISTSLAMVLLNVPVAVICSRSISMKFTFFSLFQVLLTSAFLKIFHFSPIFQDIVLNVIFGGVLYGFSVVIALKGNASTGGTDFIALYVSNKTGRTIWSYVFGGNVAVLCVYGFLFGWHYAGYSIIFQFVATKMISTFHRRYERVTLQITTSKAKEVVDMYVRDFRHGISCVEAVGGYSKKKMYLLHSVVSSYEVNDIVEQMRQVDSRVIINMLRTEQFYGGFYRAPME